MSKTEKPKIWKTQEELEEQRKQKESTVEELQQKIRKLKTAGYPLPRWLVLKQLLTLIYLVLSLGILYWGLSAPMTIKLILFLFAVPLDFILIDYMKLVQGIKQMIREI